MDIIDTVAANIKTKREAHEPPLTINALALRAQVPWSRLRDYEAQKSTPSLEILQRIADALECTVADLVS